MICQREKVDMLSSMADEVLSQILSLMPTKYAVRTSILSKRWRYLWMSVTNLDFDDIQPNDRIDSITECVDQVLNFCKTSHVKLFRLPFSGFSHANSSISRWINEAVKLNVCELDIRVRREPVEVRRKPDVEVRHELVELPLSLFTCKTLTSLTFRSVIHDWDVGNLSLPVSLPCLKILDVDLFEEHSIILFKLIRGCPVLEDLELELACDEEKAWDDSDSDDEDYEGRKYYFNIPTLKRFKLTILGYSTCLNHSTVYFNLPNLTDLVVGGDGLLLPSFVIEDLSSLVEAAIQFYGDDHYESPNLLEGISATRYLSWLWLHPLTYSFKVELPIFSKLVGMEVKYYIDWFQVRQFLQNAPRLELLCIDKCITEEEEVRECKCCSVEPPRFPTCMHCRWIDPPSVPACMLTRLETLNVSQGHLHMEFFKYMLGNAQVLKTLKVTESNLSLKEELQLCAQLLKFPRASRDCKVYFVGEHVSI